MTAIEMTLKSFAECIGSLLKEYSVLAPARVDGKLDYIWLDDPSQMELGDELPYKSPKEVLFPRVEPIIQFTKDGIVEPGHHKPILLVGVKPCDITSINMLDILFSEKNNQYDDPYYKRRRKMLITIGMECLQKKRGCFCEELGIDRTFSDSCDAFITFKNNSLVINILNANIESIFLKLDGKHFNQAPCVSKQVVPAQSVIAENQPSMSHGHANLSSKLNTQLSISADECDLFESIPWDKYSESCLSCGTCTYICPTCHCFEFQDVEKDGVITRNRCWDSCMYQKFTLHASGHNPRPTQKERFRQRVLHKYVYIPKKCSIIACTGCGRCIRSCPGGVNIYKTVKNIISHIQAPNKKGAVK